MNGGEIDRIPVNQLMQRYGLVKSAVYKRLNDLGIDPQKVGNKSYVNAEQLRLLDDLHQFIKSGGTMPEFLESRGIQPAQNLSSGDSSGLSKVQPDMINLVSAIAAQFANRLQPPPDPLAYYQKLEDAARNGWLMRTSEIADLLDLSISEMQYYGDRFSEAGFTFTKSGYRAGGEIAWKVSKERS
ncbi:hypothetical protein [Thermoleptolyngbya sp. C42_A2020_037]|uniref:hypothetical protein n=1 Tax=Thermoleptolyngbya sp. C42_A2020_037 TaxID=2747799 RepID=UPI001A07748E|nr:hypothetical protein [Thermoleptolyngbya sp. C42_A2020_037]MBF2086523.1 hypothetical protein [Thermoleptolyngbya sp. C42_A2020_037]